MNSLQTVKQLIDVFTFMKNGEVKVIDAKYQEDYHEAENVLRFVKKLATPVYVDIKLANSPWKLWFTRLPLLGRVIYKVEHFTWDKFFVTRDDERRIEDFLLSLKGADIAETRGKIEEYLKKNDYKITEWKPTERPMIKITHENGRVIATGDTYHIRFTLKKLGFKYAGEGQWINDDERIINVLKHSLKNVDVVDFGLW